MQFWGEEELGDKISNKVQIPLMDEDPLSFLQYCTKEDIMTFLRVDTGQVPCLGRGVTLYEHWRV
jgi:hypothetical protein